MVDSDLLAVPRDCGFGLGVTLGVGPWQGADGPHPRIHVGSSWPESVFTGGGRIP